MNISVRTVHFAGAFVVARAALFLAPILLANLVSIADYGRIETAQAIGGILSVCTAFGLSSTVPLILIRNDQTARWDTLLVLVMAGSAAMLACAAVGSLIVRDLGSQWVLGPLATGLLMLQGLWSTVLKSRGDGTSAVLLEASFWLVALAGGALYAWCGRSMGWIFMLLFAYGLLLLAATVRTWLPVRADFGLSDLRNNLQLSAPLLLTSLLSIFVSTAGRTILGVTTSGEVVGLYAVLYRATALPLVAHQILIIWQFRQIFSWEEAQARKYLPLIALAVAACIFAQWVLIEPLGWALGKRFDQTFIHHEKSGGIILAQTVLWSAIALNDLLNSRLKIAKPVVMWTGPFLGFSAAALLAYVSALPSGAAPGLALDTFVTGYAALMLGFYLVQCFAMYRNGARYPELWSIAAGTFIGMTALSLFAR